MLTTFDTDEMVLTALRHGAAGFLLKDTPAAQLVHAVRRVAAGEPILSPTVTAQVIAAATRAPDAPRRLARERLEAPVSPRASARSRSRSPRACRTPRSRGPHHLGIATVKTHVGSLFTKLDATNRRRSRGACTTRTSADSAGAPWRRARLDRAGSAG